MSEHNPPPNNDHPPIGPRDFRVSSVRVHGRDVWQVYGHNEEFLRGFSSERAARQFADMRRAQFISEWEARRSGNHPVPPSQPSTGAEPPPSNPEPFPPIPSPPPPLPLPPPTPPVPPPPPPAPAAPPPPAIPAGYRYIPAHVRRVSRDIEEIGEERREPFRGFPGMPARGGFGPAPTPAPAPQITVVVPPSAVAHAAVPAPIAAQATTPPNQGTTGVPASLFPANMRPGIPTPPLPVPLSFAATPHTPLSAFPINMQAAALPPIPFTATTPPPPTRFQQFQGHFQAQTHANLQHYGHSNAVRTAIRAAGMAFPEVAVPAAATTAFIGGLAEAIKKLHSFAEGLVEANRHMANYSPRLAAEYARLNVHDFHRNMRFAHDTESTSAGLVRAVDKMRESLQEMNTAWANMQNFAGAAGAGFLGELTKGSRPWLKGFNRLMGGGDGDEGADFGAGAAKVFKAATPVGWMMLLLEQVINPWLVKMGLLPDPDAAQIKHGPADQFAIAAAKGQLGGPLAGRRPGQPGVKPFRHRGGF